MLDFLDFDDFWNLEAAKQRKHMHMRTICLPEIFEISEIVKIRNNICFSISLTNFHLGVICLRRKYRPSIKTMRKEKLLDFVDFDDFWYLEAAEQTTHLHMCMICFPEICEISEIAKIKKHNHFQTFLPDFHVGVICLRRKCRPSKQKDKKWENVRFSRFRTFLKFRSCRASKTYAYGQYLLARDFWNLRNHNNRKKTMFSNVT